MNVWVVIATSCRDCNSMAVRCLDHEPGEDEIDAVRRDAGGGWCVGTKVIGVVVNGPVAPEEIDYYN